MTTEYMTFLAGKRPTVPDAGFRVAPDTLHADLLPHQRAIVAWALRKGRCAVWADTGLGKAFIALEWSRQLLARGHAKRVLILAPLAVAQQFVREGTKWGVPVTYARDGSQAIDGVTVSNYERLHLFDASTFEAVVLDESSVLKSFDGSTKAALVKAFARTPYRLCCTATPAPNDLVELCNHAEFLSIMRPAEMVARFFTVRGAEAERSKQKLKRHCVRDFYQWLASWAIACKLPSDLGYSDDGYVLPTLSIEAHFVAVDWAPDGHLFFTELKGVTERAKVRRTTVDSRVEAAVRIVDAEPAEQWLLWYGRLDEARGLAKALPGAEIVQGSDSVDRKEDLLRRFADGEVRVLITHPSIAGFGLNFQSCARMAFVGLSDSYESYYQSIRRSWRFGQVRPVTAHIVLTEPERAIYDNVLRKEREAGDLTRELVQAMAEFERLELADKQDWSDVYDPVMPMIVPAWLTTLTGGMGVNVIDQEHGKDWTLYNGDSSEVLMALPEASVDLTVTSIPFGSLYTYSPSVRDLGNNASHEEFWTQFRWVSEGLMRVHRPGSMVCIHVSQLAEFVKTHGQTGRYDFRGDTIRHFRDAGFTYYSEITINKNPQAQAIRTHAKGLLFVQLDRDSREMWQAIADYVLVFRTPGTHPVKLETDVTREEWIKLASPVWWDIRESDILPVIAAREEADERHICPLQLPVIRNCIRLWSGPGEVVLDPFNGIGSTGHEALKLGRKYVGVELKPSYYKVAAGNLRAAEASSTTMDMFAAAGVAI